MVCLQLCNLDTPFKFLAWQLGGGGRGLCFSVSTPSSFFRWESSLLARNEKKVSWIDQDIKQPSAVCLSLLLPWTFPQVLVSWKAGQWPNQTKCSAVWRKFPAQMTTHTEIKSDSKEELTTQKQILKPVQAHLFVANCLLLKKICDLETWTTLVGLPQIFSLANYVCSLFLWYYHFLLMN